MFPVEVRYLPGGAGAEQLAQDIVTEVGRLPESEHVTGGLQGSGSVHLVVFVCANSPLDAETLVRQRLGAVTSRSVKPPSGQFTCEAVLEAAGRLRPVPVGR